MEVMAPFLVPITLFISVAAIFIFRGPLGKALGERISGRPLERGSMEDAEALHADMDELRARLSEVEERLDFTERMLAQQSRKELPPEG